jgi:hypothetical protein
MLHLMICGARRRSCAAPRAGSWNRFNCCSGTAIQTTERYFDMKHDLSHAPNDAIKLKLAV